MSKLKMCHLLKLIQMILYKKSMMMMPLLLSLETKVKESNFLINNDFSFI